jgi:DNA modification methylase
MVWTDPPYLMDFTGAIGTHGEKRQRHDAITNDKMTKEQGERFLRDIASMIKAKCKGAFYVSFYRLGIEWMMRAITDSGLHWRNLIIWRKNNINLSNSDYKSQYEPLVYGFIDDYQSVLYGWTDLHFFRGPKGQADVMEYGVPSVWDIDKTKKNALHPTVKPVALIERSIMNSSLTGQTVLDLFGGSGSHDDRGGKTGRKARLMELEPKYVDVICRRFHMFTGIVPTHAETGERSRSSASPRRCPSNGRASFRLVVTALCLRPAEGADHRMFDTSLLSRLSATGCCSRRCRRSTSPSRPTPAPTAPMSRRTQKLVNYNPDHHAVLSGKSSHSHKEALKQLSKVRASRICRASTSTPRPLERAEHPDRRLEGAQVSVFKKDLLAGVKPKAANIAAFKELLETDEKKAVAIRDSIIAAIGMDKFIDLTGGQAPGQSLPQPAGPTAEELAIAFNKLQWRSARSRPACTIPTSLGRS